jgi:hypothetical protein
VYGPWSGAPDTPRQAACLRYQQKNPKTGAPLATWTYTAVDLAACDLTTGKPLGSTYNSVAVDSTVMCCAEPDCNAPDPQLDTLTKTGPTITQALLQQDPAFDVSTIKRVYKATPSPDGEVVPLPHVLHTSTNGNGGVVYMPMAGSASAGDDNEQANSMLEYQLLQSGVMSMGADGYGAGSYGGYSADGMYGGQVSSGVLSSPATSASDASAGTLEEGQYTYSAMKPAASSDVAASAAGAGAGSSASAKTSGADVERTSLSVVALIAVIAAGLAMH